MFNEDYNVILMQMSVILLVVKIWPNIDWWIWNGMLKAICILAEYFSFYILLYFLTGPKTNEWLTTIY